MFFIGLNQIKTVFDPEYERYQTLEGYDRISQYYLRPGDYNTDDEVDSDDESDNDGDDSIESND